MRAEQMMRDYKNLKSELQITAFQLGRFKGVDAEDIILSMQFPHPEGERVQGSGISDKTAKTALNYQNIMEKENDEWFDYLFNRYEYLSGEISFFEDCIRKLPGVLAGVVTDLLDEDMMWDTIAAKYHVSTAMIAKYKKKAVKELDIMYEIRDRQTEGYILG